jgi:hypothetical protein
MQPLLGTRDREGDRMPRWSTTDHSLIAAALATGLLLMISTPIRAENRLDPWDQSCDSIVPLGLIQLAPCSSISQRLIQGLPAEHVETIQRFIGAINERRPTAVGMLSAELIPNAAAKREWTRHFSAIKSIHVIAIEPSAVATMAPCYEYKVKLEAHVSADPEAAMPFYGWEDNPNFRWIRLCPDARGTWAISSFGTGP